ncbi:hypothetical protein HG15A2_42740 [Adhaeretor mobilis]|uniref:Uncharacterized protein n=1 Tax=Adhaeretor mobilis TaxID=1930276 RepID=A0A517N1C1_9BACT|nr:hypothetical protein HG15A2_42740 [Adhaeretor mobilis]
MGGQQLELDGRRLHGGAGRGAFHPLCRKYDGGIFRSRQTGTHPVDRSGRSSVGAVTLESPLLFP